MPVRRVSSRGGNFIGLFPSHITGKSIAYESTIERDALYLLDFMPTVRDIVGQPLKIQYSSGQRIRSYTPDFLVTHVTYSELIECKPASKLHDAETLTKAAAATEWCQEHGLQYRLLTDRDLRSGYLLQNVKRITIHSRSRIPAALSLRIAQEVANQPSGVSIGRLAEICAPFVWADTSPAILCLIYHHALRVDLESQPLSRNSILTADLDNPVWREYGHRQIRGWRLLSILG